jgi:outer membrane receptor protein involved in Fe transport
MRSNIWICTVVAASLLALAGPAFAQRTEGSIAGTVTDDTGAVIRVATVTLTNVETGEVTQVFTNNIGYYRAPILRPGRYEVRVQASGFSPVLLQGVEVRVNNVTRADANMALGTQEYVVTVESGGVLVQTEEARLQTTVPERLINELPLSGRDIYSLPALQAGVTTTNAPVISNTSFNTFDKAFVSNGASMRGNNFVLDGTTNNNEWLGGTPAITPSLEAVQEFQMQTLNFSAEYGRTNGSVMNIVTKSGTNEFRGSTFWYGRNNRFNARNFFDVEELPMRHHQFGGAIGGPLVKNRTFFFGNYEASRLKTGYTSPAVFVETPEFRQLVQATRPSSLAAMFYRDFPVRTACTPGTAVDTGSIPARGSGVFTVGPRDGIVDYCFTAFSDVPPAESDQYVLRMDHGFSDGDRFHARWIADTRQADVSREQFIPVVRGFRANLDGAFKDLNSAYTKVFSSTLVNELRLAYNRSDFGIHPGMPAGETRSILERAGAPDFFGTLFFDDNVAQMGRFLFIPRDFVFNVYTLSNVVTSVRGRHTMKVGGEWRYVQENSNYEFETRPFFEFWTIFNFANDEPYWHDALVNRLPGDPNFGRYTDSQRNFRRHNWALFAQDDWKPRPNLTLNLGLRYEVFGGPSEKQGRMSNIVLPSEGTIFERMAEARFDRVDELFRTDYNNFAPRLGVAWDPTGSGKTSVRTGFGVAYLEPYSNMWSNSTRFTPPDATWIAVAPALGRGTTINYVFPFQPSPDMSGPPSPTNGVPGTQLSSNAVHPDLHTAYSMQWFAGIQREIANEWGISANYVGTRGESLYLWEDYNRFVGDIVTGEPFPIEDRLQPEYGTIWLVSNAASSIYHGANVSVVKRYSRNFQFQANYTIGKITDYPSSDPALGDMTNVSAGAGYLGAQDVRDSKADRGPGEFDVRHRFTFSGIWDLPSPDTSNGFLRGVLGGWQLNGVVSVQSGRPFTVRCTRTVTAGCDWNRDGDEHDRPNDPGLASTGYTRQQFVNGIFTTADFCPTGLATCVPAGTNGNLGRNTFRGPGYATVDTGLFKNIPLGKGVKLQLRWEVFNLLNRPNLFNPNSSLGSPTFGKSTRAFSAREMQFALKVMF